MANSNDSAIVRIEENGIEYFTVVETGESGMSQRGLARACGKSQPAIKKLIDNLTNDKAPKRLKRFLGKDLNLITNFRKKGGSVVVYKADFCSAVIKHYAYLGSEKAQDIDEATGAIGLTSFIQGKTGWLPKRYQSSSSSRQLIDYILNEPKQWNLHFNSVWQREACRATGWNWQSRAMANLIANYIYKPLGKDVYERLLDINRERKSRHHQFFDATADEVILKEHIQQVGGLLRVSRSYPHFKQLFADAFGAGVQLAILD